MSKWVRCSTMDGKQVDINFDRVNMIYSLDRGSRVDFSSQDSVFVLEDADTLLSHARE
jgi:hypothetical protein